jgi:hypothetical protein
MLPVDNTFSCSAIRPEDKRMNLAQTRNSLFILNARVLPTAIGGGIRVASSPSQCGSVPCRQSLRSSQEDRSENKLSRVRSWGPAFSRSVQVLCLPPAWTGPGHNPDICHDRSCLWRRGDPPPNQETICTCNSECGAGCVVSAILLARVRLTQYGYLHPSRTASPTFRSCLPILPFGSFYCAPVSIVGVQSESATRG